MNVLIIEASPAGLFAAAELARHGIAARLVERDRTPHRRPAADIAKHIEIRPVGRAPPTGVDWFSPFHMHRRIDLRLANGRRLLVGDAAHVSSAFGGEGLNVARPDSDAAAWSMLDRHPCTCLLPAAQA